MHLLPPLPASFNSALPPLATTKAELNSGADAPLDVPIDINSAPKTSNTTFGIESWGRGVDIGAPGSSDDEIGLFEGDFFIPDVQAPTLSGEAGSGSFFTGTLLDRLAAKYPGLFSLFSWMN